LDKLATRLRTLLVMVLVLICGWAFNRIGWQVWGMNQRRIADQALAERDFTKAGEALDKCLWLDPTNGDLHLLAAQTARRRKDPEAAEPHLRFCSRDDLQASAAKIERGLFQIQSGLVRAPNSLREACEQRPAADEVTLVLEAIIEGDLASLNVPSAEKWIRVWSQHHPSSADQVQARLWRSTAFRLRDETAKARSELESAVEFAPDSRPARMALVELLVRDSPQEASPHVRWLVEHFPHDPEVMYQSAILHRSLGQLKEAAATLETLLKKSPAHLAALIELAHVKMDQQDPQTALETLQKAESLAPRRMAVLRAMHRCLLLSNQTDKANHYLERAQQLEAELEQRVGDPKKR
jgi:tetratricopeptide (TPR) repeat protein